MPAWIHDRAAHIRRKNPGMPEAMSFAIATQQAHATGNAPKGYGTAEGRKAAKKKYSGPKSSYAQEASPSSKAKTSSIDLTSLLGFSSELEKIAAMPAKPTGTADLTKALGPLKSRRALYSKPNVNPAPPSISPFIESSKTIAPPAAVGGL